MRVLRYGTYGTLDPPALPHDAAKRAARRGPSASEPPRCSANLVWPDCLLRSSADMTYYTFYTRSAAYYLFRTPASWTTALESCK